MDLYEISLCNVMFELLCHGNRLFFYINKEELQLFTYRDEKIGLDKLEFYQECANCYNCRLGSTREQIDCLDCID